MDNLTVMQKGIEKKLEELADKFISSLNTFIGELIDSEYDLDNHIDFPINKDEINAELNKKQDKLFKTAVYCFGYFQVPEIIIENLLEKNIALEYDQEDDKDVETFSLTFMHEKYKKFIEENS